jgi:hypothetical protein
MKFFLVSMLVMIIKASTINVRTQPPEVSVVSSQEGTTAVTTTTNVTSNTTSGPTTQPLDSKTQTTTPVSGSSQAETITVQTHDRQHISAKQSQPLASQTPQGITLPKSEQRPASQTIVGSDQQEIASNTRSVQSLNGSATDIPTVQPSTPNQRQQQADLVNKGSREETRSNLSPSKPQMHIVENLSQGSVKTPFIDKPQSDQRQIIQPPVITNQQPKVIGQPSSQGPIVSEPPNQKENQTSVAAKKVTKAVKKSKDEKTKSSKEKSKKNKPKRSTKSTSDNEKAKSFKTKKSKSTSSDKKKKSGKSKKSKSKDAEKKPKSVKPKKSNTS